MPTRRPAAPGTSPSPTLILNTLLNTQHAVGACYGINVGHGWMKLLTVFARHEEAERVAIETAQATKDPLPDGIAAPKENELEVIFPAMIAEAGPEVEGTIARTDLAYWDKPYYFGEDALARNPRTIPAQARLQDDDFIPILVRAAFGRLMKLAQARINVLIIQEMARLRDQPVRPYSELLAEELEALRGVRFSPENTGDKTNGTTFQRRPGGREPYPGADALLFEQVCEHIEARERARGAHPDQLKGGPAITGLPATWIELPGYTATLGKRIRGGVPGITSMRAIAEPLALLYALALDGDGNEINPSLMNGRQAFLDMGYLSIDVGEVYDMRPQRDTLDTWEQGASKPLQQIRARLSAHFDRQFHPYEIEMAIRRGKIQVGNRLRDLPQHWDRPLITRGEEIRDLMVAHWQSGRQFENIVLGGGWAAEERITVPIQRRFDNTLLAPRPQTSIARGYAYLARRQAIEKANSASRQAEHAGGR